MMKAMAKDSLQDVLARLAAVREEPHSPASLETLRRIVRTGASAAVARAAKLIGELEIPGLEKELAAAFDRFMVKPVQTDKGCLAKTEIARALYRLEAKE